MLQEVGRQLYLIDAHQSVSHHSESTKQQNLIFSPSIRNLQLSRWNSPLYYIWPGSGTHDPCRMLIIVSSLCLPWTAQGLKQTSWSFCNLRLFWRQNIYYFQLFYFSDPEMDSGENRDYTYLLCNVKFVISSFLYFIQPFHHSFVCVIY